MRDTNQRVSMSSHRKKALSDGGHYDDSDVLLLMNLFLARPSAGQAYSTEQSKNSMCPSRIYGRGSGQRVHVAKHGRNNFDCVGLSPTHPLKSYLPGPNLRAAEILKFHATKLTPIA